MPLPFALTPFAWGDVRQGLQARCCAKPVARDIVCGGHLFPASPHAQAFSADRLLIKHNSMKAAPSPKRPKVPGSGTAMARGVL